MKSTAAPPVTVTVNVRNLAFGGEGVGEVTSQSDGGSDLLGIAAFVPFSAPGELVSAVVTEKRKRYAKCDLTSVQQRSPARVEPRCKYFTVCGGCELQHLHYEAQIGAKYDMIRGAMLAGKLSGQVISLLEPIVPGLDYGYRRRVTLHRDSTGKTGFYRAGSRSIVGIDSCPISVDGINAALAQISAMRPETLGRIRSIILEADAEGVTAVLKSPYDLGQNEIQNILKEARSAFQNAVLMVGENEVGGFGRQILELPVNDAGTMFVRVPAGYFSQVNWEINLKLVKFVCEAANMRRGQAVHDLYSGAGNFALPLAKLGARVTAVECDKRLVALGRQNCARYKLERNLTFVEASVERFLEKSVAEAEIVVADPPRSGLGPLVPQLKQAKRFILISCHLPSFVRDLKSLLETGYSVKTIQPFDMFAQTSYVEIVSVLEQS